MDALKKEISDLKENVSVLINAIGELRKSEKMLRKENGDLRNEITNQKEQIGFLSEKSKMAGLASAIEPVERDEMRSKIRELVREIDGCIAMLNG